MTGSEESPENSRRFRERAERWAEEICYEEWDLTLEQWTALVRFYRAIGVIKDE